MGYAIAEELAGQGAEVILVSGPVAITAQDKNIKVVSVESAREMFEACLSVFPECDGAVMTAAVADFTPAIPEKQKTKRDSSDWSLLLKPTTDIAAALGKRKKENQLLVGFALETNNEIENAQSKITSKNLDLVVLNSLRDKGAGFGAETNKITLIGKDNKLQAFELKTKKEVAADIVEMMKTLLR